MTSIKTTTQYLGSILVVLLITCSFAYSEAAQEFTPRVARISYLEGPVTIQRTVDEDWSEASLNLPLMVGDKIYTGIGGRVELQLDDEAVIRLESDTYIHFANLEDTLTKIGILKGTMALDANKVPYKRTPIEIRTDTFSSRIDDWGRIRFNVRESGDAEILARRGQVMVTQGDQPYELKRGDQLRVRPNRANFETINQEDAFDQWCDFRDAMQSPTVTQSRVSTRVAGYSDLDRYGTWVDIPDYGNVWRPAVTVTNWAPYREGRWVWYDSCGWTWVSYEPWGWVPYHYGRWVYVRNYDWCWIPHTEIVYVRHHYPRPIWYPALVSFTYARHGSFFSFSIGGGYYHDSPCIGWFALGPRDPFVPWHHRHRDYYVDGHDGRHGGGPDLGPDRGPRGGRGDRGDQTRIVNNTYIDNSTHIYQNQQAPNAVTVVSEREFSSGKYENRAAANLDSSRGSEVAVGPTAVQKMEERRILETRPARDAADSGNAALSAKTEQPGSMKSSPQRIETPERTVKPERGANAASSTPDSSPAQVNESRRDAASPARTSNNSRENETMNAGTKETRSPQTSRETRPARTGSENTAAREPITNPARESIIQDRSAAGTKEPARSTTASPRTEQNARTERSPVSPADSNERSSSRSTSPIRSPQNSSSSATEPRSLIQDRTQTTSSPRTNAPLTNPARESVTTQSDSSPVRSGSNSARNNPARTYSPSRSPIQNTDTNREAVNSQSRTVAPQSVPRYSSPSRSGSNAGTSVPRYYSPNRTAGSNEYSAPPQTSSAPQTDTYSAPSNAASQSYSAPRYTAPQSSSPASSPAMGRSSSPSQSSRGSGGYSARRQ